VNTRARATPQCRTCPTRKAHTDLVAYEPNNVYVLSSRECNEKVHLSKHFADRSEIAGLARPKLGDRDSKPGKGLGQEEFLETLKSNAQ
jgi:hypothetical protein